MFFCELCFDNHRLSDVGKDALKICSSKKSVKKDRFFLGKFAQDFCDKLHAEKRDEYNTLQQLKSYGKKFKLEYMSDTKILCLEYKNFNLTPNTNEKNISF